MTKTTVKAFVVGSTSVVVQEELGRVDDSGAGLGIGWYVWPSAIKLAAFLDRNRHLVHAKRVLELGAGTALPGLLAAKLSAAHVTLTDKDEADLCNARDAVLLNHIPPSKVTLTPLVWGQDFAGGSIDVILAADCFYNAHDFEDILATMAYVIRRNPHCVVYTTYQLRSAHYTIQPYLARWKLHAKEVPCPASDDDVSVFLVEIRGC
ncbi:hypothetical protein H257_19280 [Aphanomyces astaci]|uniref:Uncharacterized protein n=1 Tax=Aphanomyces astaci TaxID=112090 RepID=W4FA38_APHAT|nr:hypothetical protein H257_19280 [Aphanomyces astaci]ETV63789.1 hypothetical protein H257_19280 [Aphanomyces astaci]|eukprot:XP_009846727.1 hypothetical protein H257_19280 [Aphanomyces astaci]